LIAFLPAAAQSPGYSGSAAETVADAAAASQPMFEIPLSAEQADAAGAATIAKPRL
jgi:hypothetical protein